MKKAYINPEIQNEINEKWFCVYNYISLKELLSTIQRDYLQIMSFINTPLAIISILVWVLTYTNIFIFLFYILLVYSLIFLYLIIIFIIRSYYFLLVSDIVYTSSWIILWNKLYDFKSENILENKLIIYEKHFDEYLSKSSNLSEVIKTKKTLLEDKVLNFWKGIFHKINKSKDPRFLILIFLFYLTYTVSLFAFYYLWVIFWFIFFLLFWWIIKIILFFRKSIEIKIKNKIEKLDKRFEEIESIYLLLSNKISKFKWWEISNIWDISQKSFESFYSKINTILEERKKLILILNKSNYKDFIDFKKLKKYIKNNFNKPINEMISLLKKYEKTLVSWIKDLDKLEKRYNKLNFKLKEKKLILEKQLIVLKAYKDKYEKILL